MKIDFIFFFQDAFVIPLGKEKLVDQTKERLSGDCRSDHLMMANIMLKWENEKEHGNPRKFAYDFFLSESVLKMLDHHKKQFAQHLHQMKFIGKI